MSRKAMWSLFGAVGFSALAGCDKKFSAPYDQLELPRDGLVSVIHMGDPGVAAVYESEEKPGAMADAWEKALEAKSYKRFCDATFKDGSVARGLKNDGGHRYRLAARAGKPGLELWLRDIPSKVDDDVVCAPRDQKWPSEPD